MISQTIRREIGCKHTRQNLHHKLVTQVGAEDKMSSSWNTCANCGESGHSAEHCIKGFSRQTNAGSITCDNCGD
ncbi:unnamed protein product, partial [Rotaria sordida]